jgi:hypothetical protein
MSHKISCIITGKVTTVSNEYYNKKISDFGSEEKFKSLYVSRQAKSLLKRGYKIKEIRNLLKVDTEGLVDIPESKTKEILKLNDDDNQSYENFSIKKSDPEVIEYIERLQGYLSSKTDLEVV